MSAQSEADRVVDAVNNLADRFTAMQGEAMDRKHQSHQPPPIDMMGYGALIARVGHLEGEVLGLRHDMKAVLSTLQEAQGGWRTLMWVGGVTAAVGSAIGGIVSWFISHLPKG